MKQPNFGENEGIWEYKNLNGDLLLYVVRYLLKSGKKAFKPVFFQNGEWCYTGYQSAFKPIYRLEFFDSSKPTLIVEGEKTADYASKLFPEYNVLSWMGGANSAGKANWDFLEGRLVYILPDNDKAGYKAYHAIKNILATVRLLDIRSLNLKNDGWDIADLEGGEVDFEDIKGLFVEADRKATDFNPASYPFMSDTKNPYPLDIKENLDHLLHHFGITVKFNMMKRKREVNVPNVKFYFEEAENCSLNYIADLSIKNSFSIRRTDKHLDSISYKNIYHPVRDWILSSTLSKSIFNDFLKNIQTTNNELSYLLIKRWMIAAVASLFTDSGFCNQGVLVIQGEPGTHKSSFIMSLVPEEMRAIKGGMLLDPSRKDDVFMASSYWIAELGELDATFRKSDIARLKSYITNDVDDVRRAYSEKNSQMIRRTAFAATVNENRFLVDETGNRRWWSISITEPINTHHGLDMQQVWREVYEMWKAGESPILLEEELLKLNMENKKYEYLNPLEEKVLTHFDWNQKDRFLMTSTQVLDVIGYDKPNASLTTKMGILLVKLNVSKGSGRNRRAFWMPKARFNPVYVTHDETPYDTSKNKVLPLNPFYNKDA